MAAAAVVGKLGSVPSAGSSDTSKVVAQPVGGVPAVSASLLSTVAGRLKEYSVAVYGQRRPWAEMLDWSSLARPTSLSEATGRLRRNLAYFKVNYLVCMVVTTLLVMIMNPWSLLVLGGLAASWAYVFVIRTVPIMWGERALTDREKVMGMGGASVVVIFFLTSVASILFSAIGLSVAVIAAHGSARVPDDLFLDESEVSGSFMGIFTQPAQGQPALAV